VSEGHQEVGPDGSTPQWVYDVREARKRQQHIDRATAPSYFSAFPVWQWIAAAVVLVIVGAVFAH
jgi:hypothetical protein